MKNFSKNLRRAKISEKILGGVKIFLNFPEFTLIFLCFLGGGLKIFSENLRGPKIFGRNWRGSENFSIFSENTPTGYPSLKKSRPLATSRETIHMLKSKIPSVSSLLNHEPVCQV